MGKLAERFLRFPLLLKFLDAREMLSVQVHPGYPPEKLLPEGEAAKTEAWVVLEAGKKAASMRASSRGPPRTFSGNRSRTRR